MKRPAIFVNPSDFPDAESTNESLHLANGLCFCAHGFENCGDCFFSSDMMNDMVFEDCNIDWKKLVEASLSPPQRSSSSASFSSQGENDSGGEDSFVFEDISLGSVEVPEFPGVKIVTPRDWDAPVIIPVQLTLDLLAKLRVPVDLKLCKAINLTPFQLLSKALYYVKAGRNELKGIKPSSMKKWDWSGKKPEECTMVLPHTRNAHGDFTTLLNISTMFNGVGLCGGLPRCINAVAASISKSGPATHMVFQPEEDSEIAVVRVLDTRQIVSKDIDGGDLVLPVFFVKFAWCSKQKVRAPFFFFFEFLVLRHADYKTVVLCKASVEFLEKAVTENWTQTPTTYRVTAPEISLLVKLLEHNRLQIDPKHRQAWESSNSNKVFRYSYLSPIGEIPPNKMDKIVPGVCNSCGKTDSGTNLKRCSSCQAAKYCSKECQKADWKSHKLVCKKVEGAIPSKDGDKGTQKMFVSKEVIQIDLSQFKLSLNSSKTPVSIHGTRPFTVKIQVPAFDSSSPILIYDESRAFQIQFSNGLPNQFHAAGDAAVHKALYAAVKANPHFGGMKRYFMAQREGIVLKVLMLEKVDQLSVKW
ncbi:hypothetical protein BDR26DRAFT_919345 [Obelidium mucronatum]|nr:hypothetical protein BDR26DRAFT_919345 [Obelidium mucronatum]